MAERPIPEIEKARLELYRLIESLGRTHPLVISASQQLDKMILSQTLSELNPLKTS